MKGKIKAKKVEKKYKDSDKYKTANKKIYKNKPSKTSRIRLKSHLLYDKDRYPKLKDEIRQNKTNMITKVTGFHSKN